MFRKRAINKNILLFQCTLFAFIFLIGKINAQSDFRSGYYISNKNDTVYGLLDFRGEIRNAKVCVFKESEESESKTFLPGEIAAYRFDNSKYYVSRTVKIENENRTVFLEYLVNGITDLFFYRDIDGDIYFIEDKDGTLHELVEEEKIVAPAS